jgi:hypothetical protein
MVFGIALPPLRLSQVIEEIIPLFSEVFPIREELQGMRTLITFSPQSDHIDPGFVSRFGAIHWCIDLE